MRTGLRAASIIEATSGTSGARATSSATASTAREGTGTVYQPRASARSPMVTAPLPARLYGPGGPLASTPATKAEATSSSWTIWKGNPGSGSTGRRPGSADRPRLTGSGSASATRV